MNIENLPTNQPFVWFSSNAGRKLIINASFLLLEYVAFNNLYHSSSSSPDISPEAIIQFGLHWMKETTSAVYDEKEKEIISSELKTLPDLREFFTCIYTFLNGDI